MQDPVDRSADFASVREWIDGWGREVAAVDLTTARSRFAPDVVAFGTRAEVVRGLDALHDDQWSQVWPAIEDFTFLTSQLVVQASPDGLQAVAIVPWTSTGITSDGRRFERPGRATVVLRRDAPDGRWYGTHTHFSLAPEVPDSSHGTGRTSP